MGSLVSQAAQDCVLKYIELGKQEGARLVLCGSVPDTAATDGGFFVEPTIHADVKQPMRIAMEEIFGRLMSVLKWENEEELFQQVNAVEYGLCAAIFTNSIKTMQNAVRLLANKGVGQHDQYALSWNAIRGIQTVWRWERRLLRGACFDDSNKDCQCGTVTARLDYYPHKRDP